MVKYFYFYLKTTIKFKNIVKLNEESEDLEKFKNSNEIKHYISPIIFHDEETKENHKVNLKDSIMSYMLRNPLILFGFLVIGFYVYPTLWKKEFFMELSEDYNNKRILDNHDKIYDYINYRRGLYVSVRSNFS